MWPPLIWRLGWPGLASTLPWAPNADWFHSRQWGRLHKFKHNIMLPHWQTRELRFWASDRFLRQGVPLAKVVEGRVPNLVTNWFATTPTRVFWRIWTGNAAAHEEYWYPYPGAPLSATAQLSLMRLR